jgi:hypothetical protein
MNPIEEQRERAESRAFVELYAACVSAALALDSDCPAYDQCMAAIRLAERANHEFNLMGERDD